MTGFAVEYLDRFAAATGLKYEPVVVDTYEEALALVEGGQVDLVACVASNSSLASLEHVRFTVPFSIASASQLAPIPSPMSTGTTCPSRSIPSRRSGRSRLRRTTVCGRTITP